MFSSFFLLFSFSAFLPSPLPLSPPPSSCQFFSSPFFLLYFTFLLLLILLLLCFFLFLLLPVNSLLQFTSPFFSFLLLSFSSFLYIFFLSSTCSTFLTFSCSPFPPFLLLFYFTFIFFCTPRFLYHIFFPSYHSVPNFLFVSLFPFSFSYPFLSPFSVPLGFHHAAVDMPLSLFYITLFFFFIIGSRFVRSSCYCSHFLFLYYFRFCSVILQHIKGEISTGRMISFQNHREGFLHVFIVTRHWAPNRNICLKVLNQFRSNAIKTNYDFGQ